MANPIRRLVQLVLDKAAARKLQKDAEEALSPVDAAFGRIRKSAAALAGSLIGLFAGRALVNFAKAAIREAANTERQWSSLRNTIEATGEAFDPLEGRIRMTADAFQDATVHGGGEFLEGLQRLVSLTGDVEASLQNMGLVANVAARFFEGDLVPATELVGRVMNGNTTQLQKMGIQVRSAQEGLDVLAQRSFGAATAEAATFNGQLRQVGESWNGFLDNLGQAVVANDSATNALGILRSAIDALTQSVIDNRDEISGGFTKALVALVEILDGVYRGVRASAEILGGAFLFAVSFALKPLSYLASALAVVAEGAGHIAKAFGFEGAAGGLEKFGEKVTELARTLRKKETIDAFRSVGGELVTEGIGRLGERTQVAEDVLAGIRNPRQRRTAPGFLNAPPRTGKNLVTDDAKKAQDALEAFEKAMRSADAQAALLGSRFDLLGARSSALQSVIKALTEAGVSPADARLQQFARDLIAVEDQQGSKKFADGLAAIRAQAALLGPDFDQASAEASLLQNRIQELVEQGADPASMALREMGEEVQRLNDLAERENAFRSFEEDMKRLGVAAQVAAGALDENGQPIERNVLLLENLRSEAALLESTLTALTPDDPRWDALAAQLEVVRGNMARVQQQAKVMAEAAALAGAVVGAALAGGIVPFAKMKARENLINAAEETARGIAASLSIFGAFNAAKHFTLAAKYTGIAAAWGSLAKGAAAVGLGGGGGSSAGARAAGGAAAGRAEAAPPEVSIYLTGPGWSALNPEIQKVVYGSLQQARERYGENANVRLQLGGSSA